MDVAPSESVDGLALLLACGLQDGVVRLLGDQQLVRRIEHSRVSNAVHCVAFSPDRRWLAVGGGRMGDGRTRGVAVYPLGTADVTDERGFYAGAKYALTVEGSVSTYGID